MSEPLTIGQRVRATRDIYEGPTEDHPGGFFCRCGDTLIVRKTVSDHWFAYVSHEGRTDSGFGVKADEIVTGGKVAETITPESIDWARPDGEGQI